MEGCQKGQQAQRSWPPKKRKKEKGTCAVHLCKNLTILNNMYMWGENYELRQQISIKIKIDSPYNNRTKSKTHVNNYQI